MKVEPYTIGNVRDEVARVYLSRPSQLVYSCLYSNFMSRFRLDLDTTLMIPLATLDYSCPDEKSRSSVSFEKISRTTIASSLAAKHEPRTTKGLQPSPRSPVFYQACVCADPLGTEMSIEGYRLRPVLTIVVPRWQ